MVVRARPSVVQQFPPRDLRVSKSATQKSQEVPETDELHKAFSSPSLYKQ